MPPDITHVHLSIPQFYHDDHEEHAAGKEGKEKRLLTQMMEIRCCSDIDVHEVLDVSEADTWNFVHHVSTLATSRFQV